MSIKPRIATKTLEAIEASMYADQGTRYRQILKDLLPKMEDAYRATGDRHRSHFGLSNAGEDCGRKLWYSWRWTVAKLFPARILRLFNRGHIEEARFLAMLMAAGFDVYFETPEGGQFKIEDFNGHAGSALDGVVIGIPDLPAGLPALVEMKTHNNKSFTKLKKEGVRNCQWKHFTQMQVYMRKNDLHWALYMAVNKDTDELWGEIIELDMAIADRVLDRVGVLIYTDEAPARVNNSPGWYECKYCDYHKNCHGTNVPEINCRTCISSSPVGNKEWHCSRYNVLLPKERQLSGCDGHIYLPSLLNGAVLTKDRADDEGYVRIQWHGQEVFLADQTIDGRKGITSKELLDRNV